MRTDLDLNYFKAKLEAERAILDAELGTIGVINPDNHDDWQAVADNVAAESHDDVAERMEDMDERKAEEVTLEKQLERVNNALELLSSGSYGTCTVCANLIEKERLEAVPTATTCKTHLNQETN
ncbi:MAG: TraR/DksA C4-type zinc finger protein [bacterium]